MGYDWDLTDRANPAVLASQDTPSYPADASSLLQLLTAHQNGTALVTSPKQLDYIDFVDSVLYNSATDDSHLDVDLDAKLLSEYFLWQVSRFLPTSTPSLTTDEVMKLEPGSKEWYHQALSTLMKHNIAFIDGRKLWQGQNHHDVRSNYTKLKDIAKEYSRDVIQELVSYTLSNAIKLGININPKPDEDPLTLLRSVIDLLLRLEPVNDHLNNSTLNESYLESESFDAEHSISEKELTTALKDLKLAHKFLTKKYADERKDHTRNVDTLNKVVNELQEKVLRYEKDAKQKADKINELEDILDRSSSLKNPPIIPVGQDFSSSFQSPIMTSEPWSPSTPGSTTSSGTKSIAIMRAEFKRLLQDTQIRYEKELNVERTRKQELEKELAELKKAKKK